MAGAPPDDHQSITITIRLIRSFEHRNIKHVVFKDIPRDMTVLQLIETIQQDIQSRPGLPPPFRKYSYDTLKILHKAHGFKTSDPIINTDHDELILDANKTLQECGVENETELSFFRREDYAKYQASPQTFFSGAF